MATSTMTIDRENRGKLIASIDRYLNEEITAFKFDDEIFEISRASSDATVNKVTDILWHYYDDCKDHKVNLDRDCWNYFQRLRLLLTSDCTLNEMKLRIWSASQILALVSLSLFLFISFKFGFGQQTIALALPFGAIAIMLGAWRNRVYASEKKVEDIDLTPFSSFNELLRVRRSLPNFQRQRYTGEITRRRTRNRVAEFGTQLLGCLLILIYGPIALLAQLWPITVTNRSVVRE